MKRSRFKPTWYGVERYTDTFPGDGDLYYERGLCPANNYGLWRSVRLYRIGDGMEDREYFRLMNEMAEQAEQRGKLTDEMKERVAAANAEIDKVVFGMYGFTNDLSRLDETRRRIAEIIIALQRILREKPTKL